MAAHQLRVRAASPAVDGAATDLERAPDATRAQAPTMTALV
jgi:hypothetical protein